MRLNLKSHHLESEQTAHFVLNSRLPTFVHSPCEVDCAYRVYKEKDYSLLSMRISGLLKIDCQRCLHEFIYDYANDTTVALCFSEEVAEKMMPDYECIVVTHSEIDLQEVILDEIHLYAPQKHLDHEACNSDAIRYLAAYNAESVG